MSYCKMPLAIHRLYLTRHTTNPLPLPNLRNQRRQLQIGLGPRWVSDEEQAYATQRSLTPKLARRILTWWNLTIFMRQNDTWSSKKLTHNIPIYLKIRKNQITKIPSEILCHLNTLANTQVFLHKHCTFLFIQIPIGTIAVWLRAYLRNTLYDLLIPQTL